MNDAFLEQLFSETRRRVSQIAERAAAIEAAEAELKAAQKEKEELLAERARRVARILTFLATLVGSIREDAYIFVVAYGSDGNEFYNAKIGSDGNVYLYDRGGNNQRGPIWNAKKPDDLTGFDRIANTKIREEILSRISDPKRFLESLSSEENSLGSRLVKVLDELKKQRQENGELKAQ